MDPRKVSARVNWGLDGWAAAIKKSKLQKSNKEILFA